MSVITVRVLSLVDQKASKLAALAEKRWQVETAGIVVAGAAIKTDRESSAILTSAYILAKDYPGYTVSNWKVAKGAFITLDAPTIIALATAVRLHVQACFDREAALTASILAAADVPALDAIDIDAGWPPNI